MNNESNVLRHPLQLLLTYHLVLNSKPRNYVFFKHFGVDALLSEMCCSWLYGCLCALCYMPHFGSSTESYCFKSFLIRIRIFDSGSLKYAPTREFAKEIYCKYKHVHQAIAKAYPWNKQTRIINLWAMNFAWSQLQLLKPD